MVLLPTIAKLGATPCLLIVSVVWVLPAAVVIVPPFKSISWDPKLITSPLRFPWAIVATKLSLPPNMDPATVTVLPISNAALWGSAVIVKSVTVCNAEIETLQDIFTILPASPPAPWATWATVV